MWDRDNAPITRQNFATVVNQYKNSNSFLIKFCVSSNSSHSMLTHVITFIHSTQFSSTYTYIRYFYFQELKLYLLENGCKPIFDEETKNLLKNGQDEAMKERIAGKSLNELAKKLVIFINSKYSNSTRDDIKNVCQSALDLFTTIGGIVSTCFVF